MKIAVFITNRNSKVVYSILNGIHECAKEKNIDTFVFLCCENDNKNIVGTQIYSLPQLTDFDGIILDLQGEGDIDLVKPLVKVIKRNNIPTVTIEREIEDFPCVGLDHYNTMAELVKHVVSVHRPQNIVYLCGKEDNKVSERICAVENTLVNNHYVVSEENIIKNIYSYKQGYEYAKKVYGMQGKIGIPKAILCDYDEVAFGIIDFFENEAEDVNITKDIIITGYYNTNEDMYHYYTLTTVERPSYKIGYEASKMLLTYEKNNIFMNGKVVFGQTCNCHSDTISNLKILYEQNMQKKYFRNQILEMSDCMMNADDEKDTLEIIRQYLFKTKSDGFYMMLRDDAEQNMRPKSNSAFPYIIDVPIIWDGDAFGFYDDMETRRILPGYKKSKGDLYLVYSLQYRSRTKGYCIFKNSWYMLKNNLVAMWIMMLNTAMEITDQKIRLVEVNKRLNSLYAKDSLTGLFNRYGYEKEVSNLFIENTIGKVKSIVVFIDLDRLKYINDTFGHDYGDVAILAITGIMKQVFPKEYMKVRYGGDEFIVFGKCDENSAESIIKEFRAKIENAKEENVLPFDISASVGYTVTDPNSIKCLKDYVHEADQSMYKEKVRRKELRKKALNLTMEIDDRLI